MFGSKPTVDQILRSLFAQDEDGNIYIRIVPENPEGELTSLKNQSGQSLDSLLRRAVVLDQDNKPCLRIAAREFSKTKSQHDREVTEAAAKNIADAKAKSMAKHKAKAKAKENADK